MEAELGKYEPVWQEKEVEGKKRRPWRTRPLRERFEEKFTPVPESGCWIWMAGASGGYGSMLGANDKREKAHRVSWMLYRGEIPQGMHVCHHCDTPLCVNPDHLFLGTNADNVYDSQRKGRRKGKLNGEINGRAKLTSADVQNIRQEYKLGVSGCRLAKKYGMGETQIARIINHESWIWLEGK